MDTNEEEKTQNSLAVALQKHHHMHPLVKECQLPDDMLADAVNAAADAVNLFKGDKDRAEYIKRELDYRWKPSWHVAVGEDLSGCVSSVPCRYAWIYLVDRAVLVFKTN